MKLLYTLIIFSLLLPVMYSLENCECETGDRDCFDLCEAGDPISVENSAPNSLGIAYPLDFKLGYSFPTSSKSMYMALISPNGKILNSNFDDSIGSVGDDTFNTGEVYTNLPLEVDFGCSEGPGNYNLLVHVNSIRSSVRSYTHESVLYNCKNSFDILDNVEVPLNWNHTDELLIYCSNKNEAENNDMFDLFDLKVFNEAYMSCVIKNTNKDEVVLSGLQYGSVADSNFDLIKYRTSDEVLEYAFPIDSTCEFNSEKAGFDCSLNNSERYFFSYDDSLHLFSIYSNNLAVEKNKLNSIFEINNEVENVNTNSLLIKRFEGGNNTVFGYDLPKGFFRETINTNIPIFGERGSFDFDKSYVIFYKDFPDISDFCYNSLRGQTSSSLEGGERILHLNDFEGDNLFFDSRYEIVCYDQYVIINNAGDNFKTLFSNLVFDTVLGLSEDISYNVLFPQIVENSVGQTNQDSNDFTLENEANINLDFKIGDLLDNNNNNDVDLVDFNFNP